MIIGFLIWSSVACVFIGVGISCRKSEEPAGFFTGCKVPEIKDVPRYNKAVSRLWFVSALVYELLGVPLMFLEQNSLWFVPIVFGIIIGVITMMVVYLKIEGKYRK